MYAWNAGNLQQAVRTYAGLRGCSLHGKALLQARILSPDSLRITRRPVGSSCFFENSMPDGVRLFSRGSADREDRRREARACKPRDYQIPRITGMMFPG